MQYANLTIKLKEQEKQKTEQLKTATKVYVNLATPGRVKEVASLNVDGIGLLRAEFMIADIGVHPKKLIKEKKENVFIDKLSADLVKFCENFNPRPVVYRATDFKTNEYRNLIGGKEFEPDEPNPMLGYRGAYRYMSDPKVFAMELEAIKKVRNKFGFKNLWLMLPFVRTVRELVEVKKLISQSGLSRSPNFKLWMMVEIPSNVILLDKFCEAGIDGVSIGSNDLTMLILGTDRDNTEVSPEFDERNEAVTWAIERVIKTCLKYKVTSSICGQAPSDYPDLVEKLVAWGVTSVSVNADAVNHVRETIYHAEAKLLKKK
jgi:pyruvate,water dikinase